MAKADGRWVGISKGANLSDSKRTTVQKTGLGIPVLLALEPARGKVSITSYANLLTGTPDTVTVGATIFTAQSSAVTPGDATFRAATDNATTATSLAAQLRFK